MNDISFAAVGALVRISALGLLTLTFFKIYVLTIIDIITS